MKKNNNNYYKNKSMKWGYGSANGPSTWSKQYSIADGQRQSPVNIMTESAVYDSSLTSSLFTVKYDLERELELVNTGHSISAKINQVSEISGGPLKHTYRLEQFHFHWGSNDQKGSEHTIDGKNYPAELHLVHYNCDKYKNFGEAVDKPDGLSVVGVMIEIGDEHLGFRTLSENAENVKKPDEKFTIRSSFSPSCILPGNSTAYWTYLGSLTTPPLYESVEWIVMRDPLVISKDQLNSFRVLQDSDGHQMLDNFRPPCDLKGRQIRKSFDS